MQVIPTDDDSSVHFGGHNAASKDATTDRNFTSEGTFLVCGDLVSTWIKWLGSMEDIKSWEKKQSTDRYMFH
jgi:hypothetical protein